MDLRELTKEKKYLSWVVEWVCQVLESILMNYSLSMMSNKLFASVLVAHTLIN